MNADSNVATVTAAAASDEKHVVRDDEFIKVYNTSNSAEEAAERLGMKLESLKVRRSSLAKYGVPFKSFPRKNTRKKTPEYLDSLKKLAEEILAGGGKTEASAG